MLTTALITAAVVCSPVSPGLTCTTQTTLPQVSHHKVVPCSDLQAAVAEFPFTVWSNGVGSVSKWSMRGCTVSAVSTTAMIVEAPEVHFHYRVTAKAKGAKVFTVVASA